MAAILSSRPQFVKEQSYLLLLHLCFISENCAIMINSSLKFVPKWFSTQRNNNVEITPMSCHYHKFTMVHDKENVKICRIPLCDERPVASTHKGAKDTERVMREISHHGGRLYRFVRDAKDQVLVLEAMSTGPRHLIDRKPFVKIVFAQSAKLNITITASYRKRYNKTVATRRGLW